MVYIGIGRIIPDIISIFKILIRPSIIFPFIFTLLIGIIPRLNFASAYVLTNQLGWSYVEMSSNNLIFGLLYFTFLIILLNRIKKTNLKTLFFVGTVALALFSISNNAFLIARTLPFETIFAIQILGNVLSSLAADLPHISIIGRFSEACPKGLETTGITLLISLGNFGVISNGMLSKLEVDKFHAHNGYYERLKSPILINSLASIFLVFILPVFIA